jgi:hypothetical protein
MRGFWLPIGLRAAAIFTLGLLLYAGGRYLKHHTHFDAIDARHPAVDVAAAHAHAAEAQVSAVAATERAIEASVSADPNARLAQKLSRLGAFSELAGVGSKVAPPDFILDGKKVGSLVRFQGSRGTRDARADFSVMVRLEPGTRAVPCDIVPV